MKAFSSFHPLILLYYFLGVTLLIMLTLHPLLLLLSFLGAASFAALITAPKKLLSEYCFYLTLFLLISLTNPLFSYGGLTTLFSIGSRPVTLEAFLYGAALGGMIVSMLMWLRCANLTLTSDKFLYLFSRGFPKLGLVLTMALRFIPLFTRQIKVVYGVQKTLGLYQSNSLIERIKSSLRVFSAILIWALENAVDTAASMKARGYGLPGRTSFSLFRFTLRDAVMGAELTALFVLVLIGGASGAFDFMYYPRVSQISLSMAAFPFYAAALLLLFMPFLIQMKERLQWKFFRSRI